LGRTAKRQLGGASHVLPRLRRERVAFARARRKGDDKLLCGAAVVSRRWLIHRPAFAGLLDETAVRVLLPDNRRNARCYQV
jgi:hypothetical protein